MAFTLVGRFGGNGAYSSAGMRIWAPGQVGVTGRVGCDYPQQWFALARQAGIDTSGVTVMDSPHTLVGGMIYDKTGARRERVSIKEFVKTGAGLLEFSDRLACKGHCNQSHLYTAPQNPFVSMLEDRRVETGVLLLSSL